MIAAYLIVAAVVSLAWLMVTRRGPWGRGR